LEGDVGVRHPLLWRVLLRGASGEGWGTLPGREEERRQGRQQRSSTLSRIDATPAIVNFVASVPSGRVYARSNIVH